VEVVQKTFGASVEVVADEYPQVLAGCASRTNCGPPDDAAQVQQETTTTIIMVAIVAAAVASILGVLVASRLATLLVRLEATAAAVAQGDLAARSGLSGRGDEIGSLGRSCDAMAADLERGEASRRRYLEDAAHEMKTPLAVIDATAAAVMDGVYDHDDRHLATIRDQTRRLGRVVDDLRTISLADAGRCRSTLARCGSTRSSGPSWRRSRRRPRRGGSRSDPNRLRCRRSP
jgi:signal transduction histidine kinase